MTIAEITRRRLLAAGAATILSPFVGRARADEAEVAVFNSNETLEADGLPQKALRLALERAGRRYRLVPSAVGYPTESGATAALRSGSLDLLWVGANRDAADAADPVLFPVDRGLLGYRTFLIARESQARFSAVRSIEDLRAFIAIQGPGWGDVAILENAGIRVRTGLYRNLFRMTVFGRADFFPRAAYEALAELETHRAELPGLAVEQSLVLRYPFAVMFFVSKTKPQLREDLTRGLERAFDDGSFLEMFEADANVALALRDGYLDGRRVLSIENPFLPPAVDRIADRYWISL